MIRRPTAQFEKAARWIAFNYDYALASVEALSEDCLVSMTADVFGHSPADVAKHVLALRVAEAREAVEADPALRHWLHEAPFMGPQREVGEMLQMYNTVLSDGRK